MNLSELKTDALRNQNVDKLSQDAKDTIQAIFDSRLPASFGFPADCIEVQIEKDFYNLTEGDGTVHFHALGDTEHYLTHRGDPTWAIVFIGSKIGDYEHGKKLLNSGPEGVLIK